MSNRTFFEINHDYAGDLERLALSAVGYLLLNYLRSGSKEDAERLERYGIRVLAMRHHSDAATLNINGRMVWTQNT